MRYTFTYSEKIHLQKDFKQVLKLGRRLVHPALFIFIYIRNDERQTRRLGLITSRKLGSAVKRNRIKRRLREIFRLNKHRLVPGSDIIFIPRPGAMPLNYAKLESIILAQFKLAKIILAGNA